MEKYYCLVWDCADITNFYFCKTKSEFDKLKKYIVALNEDEELFDDFQEYVSEKIEFFSFEDDNKYDNWMKILKKYLSNEELTLISKSLKGILKNSDWNAEEESMNLFKKVLKDKFIDSESFFS